MWWRCLLICAVAAVKMAFVSIELAMASPWENDSKKKIALKNGYPALFGTTPAPKNREPIANVLVFEKNKLQYILSVDRRLEDAVTARELGDIADSIIEAEQ